MDWLLLILRVIHVGGAMAWFGGAVVSTYFLMPAAQALGPSGQAFMEQLMKRRRMGVFFPIVAALTILAGAALYWRDSNGLALSWITSGPGIAYTIGGLAAIAAFVGGMVLIGPGIAAQTAVAAELAASGAAPNAAQQARLEQADRRLKLAGQIDWPLLLVAGLTMAVGRYM